MTSDEFILHRLRNQRLHPSPFRDAPAVVAWFGAMQAQEFAMAKWAIALRLPGATDSTLQQAFDAGTILRTHVLRPTWHFVAPADIRWMLALTAPRLLASSAYRDRQLGLDSAIFKRSTAVLVRALAGGHHLTRAALEAAFTRAKIRTDDMRLSHLLMHAELEGLICSGPRQGKQFTYALLDERVPATPPLSRDEALAALSRRYFTSRGPATAHDFAWWSGLTLTDARAGIASLGADFTHETIDGKRYARPTNSSPSRDLISQRIAAAFPTFLMPDYDEYGIAYKDRSALFASPGYTGHFREKGVAYNRMLVVDGRVVGSWRRTETSRTVEIEAVSFAPLSPAARKKLAAAAARYGAFLGKTAALRFSS